ncbi:hypothetical protein [Microbacterium ureisolvens]|uniref:VIT family protein n=1 Tax=Microbacterium ureisolvens TaxID=2781186 RepID=A0ABS7HYM7_9MICO|nr:hypothetical protein [Microbacterium ureisolvens]MBW9109424.1 hypothetical protein [Microbacterium ureisolvens]
MTGEEHPDGSRSLSRMQQRRLDGSRDQQDAFVRYFKERVYATFTGLAIVLVVSAGEHAEADHAFFALVLGVIGITAAGFVSDVVSHLAVHQEFPSRAEFAVLLRVAGGALSTMIVPGILLLLAWFDLMELATSLRISSIVYIATLGVIGWVAVRRARLSWGQKLLALGILLALGLLVIALQTLAHSI